MKIIFTCGGTGGHIQPILALYQQFLMEDKKKENQYYFVGSDYGLEKELFQKYGIEHAYYLSSRGFGRSITIKNLAAIVLNIKAVRQARKIIKKIKPDLVIGTGAYPAFPITYQAKKRRIPFYLIEPNVMPGMVNRMFCSSATKVILGSAKTKKYMDQDSNSVVVGVPTIDRKSVV